MTAFPTFFLSLSLGIVFFKEVGSSNIERAHRGRRQQQQRKRGLARNEKTNSFHATSIFCLGYLDSSFPISASFVFCLDSRDSKKGRKEQLLKRALQRALQRTLQRALRRARARERERDIKGGKCVFFLGIFWAWKGINRFAEVRRAGRVVSIVICFIYTLPLSGRWKIIIHDFNNYLKRLASLPTHTA